MSVRGFFRAFFDRTSDGGGADRSSTGDELADKVRETMGPLGGGGDGRLTGSAVYRMLEDDTEADRP